MSASTGNCGTAASVYTKRAHQAEEAAIALAMTDPACRTVISDSRTAIRNYARNSICGGAVRVLNGISRSVKDIELKWFPAHMGHDVSESEPNHNETANDLARGLTIRVGSAAVSCEWSSDKEAAATYGEVLCFYRLGRRTMPPPHASFNREQAVVYRQLQTDTLPTPVRLHHVCPVVYVSDMCVLCGDHRATAPHILWNCEENPEMAATSRGLPPELEMAKQSPEEDDQLQAVQ